MNRNELKKAFERAGLPLKFIDQPRRVREQVFQMDIQRKTGGKRVEWFEMYLPNGAEVIVIQSDPKICQLVLAVKEQERTFRETVHEDLVQGMRRVKIVERREKGMVVVERKATADKRQFLIGVDERQLFMAQIRRGQSIKSVQDAHAALKPNSVTFAEGKYGGNTIRQGEWFFVNPGKVELAVLKAEIKAGRTAIQKNKAIGDVVFGRRRPGNPHMAEEIVTVSPKIIAPDASRLFNPDRAGRSEVYVRGAIKHVDHKTVKFGEWRKVILNREETLSTNGRWID